MYWNHRVVRTKCPESESGYRYEFKEVFYYDDDHDDVGKRNALMGYADAFLWSEDTEGMQELADRLLKASALPVLDETDFPEGLEEVQVEV